MDNNINQNHKRSKTYSHFLKQPKESIIKNEPHSLKVIPEEELTGKKLKNSFQRLGLNRSKTTKMQVMPKKKTVLSNNKNQITGENNFGRYNHGNSLFIIEKYKKKIKKPELIHQFLIYWDFFH